MKNHESNCEDSSHFFYLDQYDGGIEAGYILSSVHCQAVRAVHFRIIHFTVTFKELLSLTVIFTP